MQKITSAAFLICLFGISPAFAEVISIPPVAFQSKYGLSGKVENGVIIGSADDDYYAPIQFSGIVTVCGMRVLYADSIKRTSFTLRLIKLSPQVGSNITNGTTVLSEVKLNKRTGENITGEKYSQISGGAPVDSTKDFLYLDIEGLADETAFGGVQVEVAPTCP